MRLYPSTRIILLLALLTANLGPARRASAQGGCPDPNCCKTCGAGSELYQFNRNCSGGTYGNICSVTECDLHSTGFCQPYYSADDTNVDVCANSVGYFCEPY